MNEIVGVARKIWRRLRISSWEVLLYPTVRVSGEH